MGAIQPRINKAIIALLSEDDTLKGLLSSVDSLPLFWFRAPANQEPPYLVFGPQDAQSVIDPLRCGEQGVGEVAYVVELITKGITPEDGIDIMDRIGTLLDGYSVIIDTMTVDFLAVGDMCYPDFSVSEHGETHSGLIYRVLVRP